LLCVPVALLARECRDDLDEADGYTIRSVRVEGRWVPSIALGIAPGDRFTNAGVQDAMRRVQQALHSDERAEFELQNLGSVGVVHITRCLAAEGREVDVIIQAHAVRIDLFEVGGNVLPVPRSALATFYNAVPPPILALNPRIGAYQDKRYGFAPTAAINTGASVLNHSRLDLALGGRKSVDEPFYDVDFSMALRHREVGNFVEELGATGAFTASEGPRGANTFRRRAGEVEGTVRLRPRAGLLDSVYISGGYRFADDEFGNVRRTSTSEQALKLRVLAEGRAGGGFLRAAVWADGALPNGASDYIRAAGVLAFEKEFLVAPNQTIGVEATIGGGRAWSAPAYARFYGGNAYRNFLYDSPNERSLAEMPTGPLIRSLGEASSHGRNARGASSYWHMNVNLTLPIPPLSFPLIPNEEVAPGLTLKRLLKNKASDSIAFYATELEAEGVPPDEALARAQSMYGEVRPAIEYIADRANAYALKPLLMCDVAGEEDERVQAAVGGGLQLTIVTAKMELGYMQTVAGANSGAGNFFARIVFENIF
ncbi:MAG: hypothetical protein M3032_01705, partial [Verrucomicrobiota bacterium]|nr:hypothetical protein [Verrucomicrobiota bacterium]